jgi:hypothetical protein
MDNGKLNIGGGPDGALEGVLKAMEGRRYIRRAGNWRSVALAVAMFTVLVSVLWYSYPRESKKQEIIAAPIIRADAGMYKVIPEDPGGMIIPYRDSTIFEALLDDGDKNREIEELLPKDETPISRTDMFVDIRTDIIETPPSIEEGESVTQLKTIVGDTVIEELVGSRENIAAVHTSKGGLVPPSIPKPEELFDSSAERVVMVPGEDGKTELANVVAMEKAEELAKVVKEQEVKTQERIASVPIPVPSAKPDTVSSSMSSMNYAAWKAGSIEPAAGTTKDLTDDTGSYYVQLGSLGSREAAVREWSKLQSQFQNLQALGYRIEKADLGANGTFFRLQAGPVRKTQARMLCNVVTERRPGTCLVVRN